VNASAHTRSLLKSFCSLIEALWGPLIICAALFVALLTNFILRFRESFVSRLGVKEEVLRANPVPYVTSHRAHVHP
jgi:hypothetical protein